MTVAATIDVKETRDFGLRLSEAQMPAQRGHIPSLDGLRAVSITIVLLSHFVSSTIFPGGLGVYVFFVISGFLIARLLLSEQKATGRIGLVNFYLRRALRLYPVILVFVAAACGLMLFSGVTPSLVEMGSALFYYSNFLYTSSGVHVQPFIITWSLSVEEHFYLVFPALLIGCISSGSKAALVYAMAAVCIVCLALRILVAYVHPDLLQTRYFYYRTQFRLDSMAFGVLIAGLCEFEAGRRWLLRLAGPVGLAASLAVILVCLLFRDLWFRETLRYTALGCAIAVMISYVLFDGRFTGWILNHPIVSWIGRLSYSLYLWHFLTPHIVGPLLAGVSPLVRIPLLTVAAFGLAAASYYALERPLLRLRARIGSQADHPGLMAESRP